MKKRYLTKSRFQIARDCPTKLFYSGKLEYPDQSQGDSFLQSLAEGGFQVGELAKFYYDQNLTNDIVEIDYDTALDKTNALLKNKDVIIFEGAVKFESLFIRADILVKKDHLIQIIEVKAKSFSGSSEADFYNSKGNIYPEYKSYLDDIAFQKYVLMNAFPEYDISASILLVDKNSVASVNGLNSIFEIQNNHGRSEVKIDSQKLNEIGLGNRILIEIPVDSTIELIHQEDDFIPNINYFASQYSQDKKIPSDIGMHCQHCEFYTSEPEMESGSKSGFKECWKEQANLTESDFERKFIFDIWNYRGKRDKLKQGIYFIDQMKESDFDDQLSEDGMSQGKRQWHQVQSIQSNHTSDILELNDLRRFMDSVLYPLHFIDFETTSVAIPFFKGMRPYEGIAFQFSHHILHEDGQIEHKGQFLHTDPNEFPNFHFIRALKKELENDNGAIFRYASHENTILNSIYNQLEQSSIKDKKSLMKFIRSIAQVESNSGEKVAGERNMIDLLKLVIRYHYHPLMGGSNSIKSVLPAIIQSSEYIKEKYSKPIYGTSKISSLNFSNQKWITYINDGEVANPYKLLPAIFDVEELDPKLKTLQGNLSLQTISDGGAALSAYGIILNYHKYPKIQEAIRKSLLKYCELDTFAMVLIWENWMKILGKI
ncbi:DUF2779 domain-containing protein [Leptospira sp. GIMC2001]|uniref:DUF2779 domain-containing protein n=1 Tax=Leptospira sp. GIMC2001 TaxID=1513297 RepID=UPI00234923A6|nr:DUF2779 domain-containing protein [Leptospira sp. GIMC2001]WCL50730.1 DUF2779 domain-containing protein [Leptospira sp. GIMC2001]